MRGVTSTISRSCRRGARRAEPARGPATVRRPGPLVAGLAFVGLVFLAGCAGSKMPRLYVLTPIGAVEATRDAGGPAIGVGPVVMPQYLDRAEIVTRAGGNRLQFADLDRWGGQLGDDTQRVLAQNLSDLLGTDRVALYPWSDASAIALQVTVEFVRFERDADGTVALNAFWRVTDPATLAIRATGHATIAKRIDRAARGADSYEATVDLMSDALASLSQEIAAVIESLRP